MNMSQIESLHRELAAMPNPSKDLALQHAQRTGKELYDLINDPDGSNPFFSEDQITMLQMMASQAAAQLGTTHHAVSILNTLIAAARANCRSNTY